MERNRIKKSFVKAKITESTNDTTNDKLQKRKINNDLLNLIRKENKYSLNIKSLSISLGITLIFAILVATFCLYNLNKNFMESKSQTLDSSNIKRNLNSTNETMFSLFVATEENILNFDSRYVENAKNKSFKKSVENPNKKITNFDNRRTMKKKKKRKTKEKNRTKERKEDQSDTEKLLDKHKNKTRKIYELTEEERLEYHSLVTDKIDAKNIEKNFV